MQYGYFDTENREYIITRPDTPTPWANYLGSPEYGAIVSNNAAGYSFVKSGADGRLLRYRFNELNTNLPGRYIYLHDKDSSDYWSNSWQPVAKPLDMFKSECRHGTAYTVISSSYACIDSETTYYVPLGAKHEVWRVKVKNNDSIPRNIAVFGFAEFTNAGNYEQDMVNLQYTLFISRTYYKDNLMLQVLNENIPNYGGNGIFRYFGAAGAPVCGYDGDRDEFFGSYRNYGNPISVENGKCGNSLNYNANSCGVLQTDLSLAPGEEKEVIFILGEGREDVGRDKLSHYSAANIVEKELSELKSYWHSKLDRFAVKTKDENFNASVNTWNAYQCFITFIWSRAASFVYCGLRNGYGYRDTVQDIQGIMHVAPEMAVERLRFMISAQVSSGGGLPLVKYDHNPGHEDTPDDVTYGQSTGHPFYRSDDALWLFPTIEKYVKESGNLDFYDEVIPYADKDEDSVYMHLKRAIMFNIERCGVHNLPAGLEADWNDCLRMGEKGESAFVAFQLYYALKIFIEAAEFKNDAENKAWAEDLLKKLSDSIEDNLWEDDRYLRGITEEGLKIGSKNNDEASMWLNPQSWAVISNAADSDRAKIILESVNRELSTAHGVKVFAPAFKKFGFPVARMTLFNPGTKENAGIFSQTQGWIIQAEARAGNGNRAYEYYNKANPAAMNDRAEIRKLEPYAHGQFIESDYSPNEGRAHVHWLTGTASTVMIGAVEGILGVKPQYDGLQIDPCIPEDWEGFTLRKFFRGKWLNIEVINDKSQKGVKYTMLNGQRLEGGFIPTSALEDENEVKVYM